MKDSSTHSQNPCTTRLWTDSVWVDVHWVRMDIDDETTGAMCENIEMPDTNLRCTNACTARTRDEGDCHG